MGGNQISFRFSCLPPDLEDYLALPDNKDLSGCGAQRDKRRVYGPPHSLDNLSASLERARISNDMRTKTSTEIATRQADRGG